MTLTFNGKASWFGGSNDGMNTGTALGVSDSAPGVAIRPGAHYTSGQPYLGGYWLITAPNGKRALLRQTDIGPNESTGRRIDVTSGALGKLGYSEGNFPTDANFKATYLGKSLKQAQARVQHAYGGGGPPARLPVTKTPSRTSASTTATTVAQPPATGTGLAFLLAGMQASQQPTVASSGIQAPQFSPQVQAPGLGLPSLRDLLAQISSPRR